MNSTNTLLVSCIMPIVNRVESIPLSLGHFLEQDYPNAELVIINDGRNDISNLIPPNPKIRYIYTEPLGNIKSNRNAACRIAKGEIIVHWDEDDWYARDWITQQVKTLLDSGADICGLDEIQFFSPMANKLWKAKNCNGKWPLEATLAYWKHFWKKHPFKEFHTGEEDYFLNNITTNIYIHHYSNGFIANLNVKEPDNKIIEDQKQLSRSQLNHY